MRSKRISVVTLKNMAILDTDFISKLHETTNLENQTLIDKILELPYFFCCHQQTVVELQKHLPWAKSWFKEKTRPSIIHLYSDLELIITLAEKVFPVIQQVLFYFTVNFFMKVALSFLADSMKFTIKSWKHLRKNRQLSK